MKVATLRLVNEDLIAVDHLRGVPVGLRGMRCDACGEVFFGKRHGCEHCSSDQIAEIPLSSDGFLYSYTVLRVPPPGEFLGEVPADGYPIGLVELPEGVRILAPIEIAPEALEVGLAVTARFPVRVAPDGVGVVTYCFQPREVA